MGDSVPEWRDAMLKEFLRMPNPTWRTVVYALRCGEYNMLADEIEREHRSYSQHAEDLAKQFQNCTEVITVILSGVDVTMNYFINILVGDYQSMK